MSFLQYVRDWIYIPRARAKYFGATHEGYLFWVPIWIVGADDNAIKASPKSLCLVPWLRLCDWVYDAATVFMDEDSYLEIPFRRGAALDG